MLLPDEWFIPFNHKAVLRHVNVSACRNILQLLEAEAVSSLCLLGKEFPQTRMHTSSGGCALCFPWVSS